MAVMCQLPNVYVTLPIDIAINALYIIKIVYVYKNVLYINLYIHYHPRLTKRLPKHV